MRAALRRHLLSTVAHRAPMAQTPRVNAARAQRLAYAAEASLLKERMNAVQQTEAPHGRDVMPEVQPEVGRR